MGSLTITPSDELAQAVEGRLRAVRFGERHRSRGLETLLADDGATELWFRGEAVASCTEMAAEPSLGIPLDDVPSRIERRVLSEP